MELFAVFLLLMFIDPHFAAKSKLKMKMKMRLKSKVQAKIENGSNPPYHYNMNDAVATVQYDTIK